MKAPAWLGGLVGAGLLAVAVQANPPCYPVARYAPNTFNQGYYLQNEQGAWYGPCYSLMPPCQPFNGLLPPMESKKRSPTPPTMAGPGYAPYASSYLPGPLDMPAYNPAFRHGPGVTPGYPSTYGFQPGRMPNYSNQYGGPGLPPYVPPAYMYRPGVQPGLGQLPYQQPATPPGMTPAPISTPEKKTDGIQPVQNVQGLPTPVGPSAPVGPVGPRGPVFQPIPAYQPNYYPGGMTGYPTSAPSGQNGDTANGGVIGVNPCDPPPPIPIFPTHPFARSPRDFFMLD